MRADRRASKASARPRKTAASSSRGSGNRSFQASLDIFRKAKVALHPGVNVAAVGERAAGDESRSCRRDNTKDPAMIFARGVSETKRIAPVVPTISAARSGRDASAAEVIAGSIAERGKPASLRERGPQSTIFGQQLVLPARSSRRRIGEAGRDEWEVRPGFRHRNPTCSDPTGRWRRPLTWKLEGLPEQLQIQIFRES